MYKMFVNGGGESFTIKHTKEIINSATYSYMGTVKQTRREWGRFDPYIKFIGGGTSKSGKHILYCIIIKHVYT